MGCPLPPELIRPIVAQLWDDRQSLFALLFTSRAWNAEAQRTLYGTLPFPPSWKRESVATSHLLIHQHLRHLALRGDSLSGLECGRSELREDRTYSHGLVDLLHNADQLKILELSGATWRFDYGSEDSAVDFRPLLSSFGCSFRLTSLSATDIPVTGAMIEFLKEQTELKELSIFPDTTRDLDVANLVGDTQLRPGDLPRLRRLEIPLELTPLLHLGERQGLVHLWIKVIGGGRVADQKLTRLAGTLTPIAGSLQTLLTDHICNEALESFTTHLPNLRFVGYCPRCWDKVAFSAVLDILKCLVSLKSIAFHDKHIAEWLDYTRETLPRVDVLIPTSKPIRDNKSDIEGGDPQYDYHPAETFWSTLT